MLQAFMLQVVAAWKDKFAFVAIDLELVTRLVVMALDLRVGAQIFGTICAEMVSQLMHIVIIISHDFAALWAFNLQS